MSGVTAQALGDTVAGSGTMVVSVHATASGTLVSGTGASLHVSGGTSIDATVISGGIEYLSGATDSSCRQR